MGEKPSAFLCVSHSGTAAGGRPDRRHQRAGAQTFLRERLRQLGQIVVCRIDIGVRQGEEEIDAIELDPIHFSGGGQVQHCFQIDVRFGIGPFSYQAGPHRVVDGGSAMRIAHKLVRLKLGKSI